MAGTFSRRRILLSRRTPRSRIPSSSRLPVAGTLLMLLLTIAASAVAGRSQVVVTAEVDGIIHPVAVQYIRRVLDHADAREAALVVLTLRTPGGLVDST